MRAHRTIQNALLWSTVCAPSSGRGGREAQRQRLRTAPARQPALVKVDVPYCSSESSSRYLKQAIGSLGAAGWSPSESVNKAEMQDVEELEDLRRHLRIIILKSLMHDAVLSCYVPNFHRGLHEGGGEKIEVVS